MNPIVKAAEKRRSRYALKKEITMTEEEVRELIEGMIKTMPSQSNSQTARLVVLFGEEHDRFWDMTLKSLKENMSDPEKKFPKTKAKVDKGFKGAYGTILFYEDQEILDALEEKRPKYAKNVQPWSLQSAGMLQWAYWVAFAEEGIRASLQHYNELIEEEVREMYNVPSTWKMLAQMPFGIAYDEPEDKDVMPVEERVFYYPAEVSDGK